MTGKDNLSSDVGPFTIVPEWVASRVAPGPLALYVHLGLHANRGGTCFPARKTLAAAIGVSIDTVKRYTKDLQASGAITVEPRTGANGRTTSNLYTLAHVEPNRGGTHAPPPGGTHAPPTTLNQNQKEIPLQATPAVRGAKWPGVVRDGMWDSLIAACSIDQGSMTKTGSSNLGKTVNELLDAGATPTMVQERAGIFRRRYPKITLTHTTLRNRWAELAPSPRRQPGSGPKIDMA